MTNIPSYYAVYFCSVLSRYYKGNGAMAIFEKFEDAVELAEHMNMTGKTDKYFVAKVNVKPVKGKK